MYKLPLLDGSFTDLATKLDVGTFNELNLLLQNCISNSESNIKMEEGK